MEEIHYSMIRNPQTYWHLKTPVTPPCYLTINQSENCAQAHHIPCNPPFLHLAFKNALLKPFGEFGAFWARATRSPCSALQQTFLCFKL